MDSAIYICHMTRYSDTGKPICDTVEHLRLYLDIVSGYLERALLVI